MASDYLSRREWIASALAVPAFAQAASWREALKPRILPYLETHKRNEGGYAWNTDVVAHTTPTFAVVGCYHLLEEPVPDAGRVAAFLTNSYPVPERRRTERPLWRLDYEQVQALLWMKQPVESFVPQAQSWTKPAEFTTRYELGGNPVFQHQALAVYTRRLLGIPHKEQAWRDYIAARRRRNGTYNNTPASDGSGGHILNTLWGVMAAEALDLPANHPSLAEWIRMCQSGSRGYTWSPEATTGAVEDIVYTWAGLHLLKRLGAEPARQEALAVWIASLLTDEGGFQDRAGGEPNPLATYYALDCLRLLDVPWKQQASAHRAQRKPIPEGARVFSLQVEAPGTGSPSEAVDIAEALGIHLWTAKNALPGWIAAANKAARERQAAVQFHASGEDYGTFYKVPGLGTYSHLIDWVAPHDGQFGPPMPRKDHPYALDEVRRARIDPIRKAGGCVIWQFLENEELTRILLDEATISGDYGGIATFHFGNENFLHSQPYLLRWLGRIPFVALQDAHARESWWWTDMLGGFSTLYIATRPGWAGWLDALDRNHVVCVRNDAVTGGVTHWAGGTPEARDFVRKHEQMWRWWGDGGQPGRRPVGALTPLPAGTPFEAGVPGSGSAIRLRLWHDNTGRGLPSEPRTELVSLHVDGEEVRPELIATKEDRYYIHPVARAGEHRAVARIRILASGAMRTIERRWRL